MTGPLGGALDVEMRGRPEEVLATADWFVTTSGSVTDAADGILAARQRSEPVWQGGSGDAFRAKLGDAQGEVDELSVQMERAGRALGDFSGALADVEARLDQAREVASAAGLEVTATTVIPPGQAPRDPVPNAPEDPALTQARVRYTAQANAWNEIVQTVADARTRERDAHDRLVAATNTPRGIADTVNSRNLVFAGIGAASGLPHGLISERNRWSKQGEFHRRFAVVAAELEARGRLPTQGRVSVESMRAITSDFAHRSVDELRSAARNGSALDQVVGRGAAGIIGGDPAAAGWRGTAATWAPRVLKGAGVVGAAAQTYLEIKDGKPPVQAAVSAGASTLAGGATTAALLALAPAAIAGGPVTLAAVGVGIVVSMGVGYLVDEHYDEIQDFAGDTFETVKGWFD